MVYIKANDTVGEVCTIQPVECSEPWTAPWCKTATAKQTKTVTPTQINAVLRCYNQSSPQHHLVSVVHLIQTRSSILLLNGETIDLGRTKYGLQISNVLKHRAHCQRV